MQNLLTMREKLEEQEKNNYSQANLRLMEAEEELQRSGWRRQAGEGTGRRFGRCGTRAQRRWGKGMEAARGR